MSVKRQYRPRIVVPRLQLPNVELVRGELEIPEAPALDVLRKAVQQVAAEHSGEITTAYLDCFGHQHPCLIGVRTDEFRRGVGLLIDASGQVTYEYDAASLLDGSQGNAIGQAQFILDSGEAARSLCQAITRRYCILAAEAAMRSLGLKVKTDAAPRMSQGQALVSGADEVGRERRLSVLEDGAVEVDLAGFAGEGCMAAEETLREKLADYGLAVELVSHRRKPPETGARWRDRALAQAEG